MNGKMILCTWLFYRKLIVPTLLFSVLAGFLGSDSSGSFSLKSLGVSYILFSLMFHYFIYEVRSPHEYYFYHNLGLSKTALWASTLFTGLLLCLLIFLVWMTYLWIA